MAAIVHDRLSFEIRYRAWEHGWVVYDIAYGWGGEPIFNDAVMKRHNDYWDGRGPGEFHANDDDFCCFIPLLDKVIEEEAAAHVTTLDPDVTLAIWPHDIFPFMPSKYRLIFESPDAQRGREAEEVRRREAGGTLPTDSVELMLFVDTYNFRDSGSYSGEGVCLRMQPTWSELQLFRAALKAEFRAFAQEHGIVAEYEEKNGDLPKAWAWLKS